MPKFNKSKRYKDKNGHTFGKGVWYDDNGLLMMLIFRKVR